MDALTVDSVPAVIDTNYEAVRAQLETEIAKYDIVVTVDTVKDAKAMATQLNKLKGEIATRRKEEVAKASEPVRAFEAKVKSLEAMCEDGRQKILSQVAAFEEVTLKVAAEELAKYLAESYAKQGVTDEFQTAKVDDLVKLGALTATGNLTKGAREAVAARVGECQIQQQRTALRLSQLENESHRAGLHSPLTREHVAGILFYDDEARYQDSLKGLIERELERQQEILDRAEQLRPRVDAPAVPVVEQEQPEPEFIQADFGDGPQPGFEPEPVEPRPVGPTRPVQIAIKLEVDAPLGVSRDTLIAVLRGKLATVGIEKSIKSITALEVPQQGAA